jgi:hypothetical protein
MIEWGIPSVRTESRCAAARAHPRGRRERALERVVRRTAPVGGMPGGAS